MKYKVVFAAVLMIVASILIEILYNEIGGTTPVWLSFSKIIVLIGAYVLCMSKKDLAVFSKYAGILITIIIVQIITDYIGGTSWWKSVFTEKIFSVHFGSAILLKLIGILPVLGCLFVMFRTSDAFYFRKGDLAVKADKIGWLGIDGDWISWGRLAIISGLLISAGTLILTMATVTGFSVPQGIEKLWVNLPFILLFAIINSFCEGIIFRNAILSTLKDALPKSQVVLMAAIFFGIAHYYGAPGGVIGVVMSGVLGWFLCRSMYETKGFVSSWLIHMMQDIVIFSTVCVLGF